MDPREARLFEWRGRLAFALVASALLHVAAIRGLDWRREVPDRHRNDLTARIVALPSLLAPPREEAPPPPALPAPSPEPPAPPREPPARPAPVSAAPAVEPQRTEAPPPAEIASPPRNAPAESRIRGTVQVEIDEEPDPPRELESDVLDPRDYLPAKAVQQRATLDEDVLARQLRWPADVAGRRRPVAVPLMVFVDEEGQVRDCIVLEAGLPDAFVEVARAALSAARYEPARVAGKAVRSRLPIRVQFGYD